ncbi:MAG: hypothetical protein DI582_05715 [Azospirillum brasilense]|nr:MAG: hypothetical protein DI582_05715 [Azospirillum brasilense]
MPSYRNLSLFLTLRSPASPWQAALLWPPALLGLLVFALFNLAGYAALQGMGLMAQSHDLTHALQHAGLSQQRLLWLVLAVNLGAMALAYALRRYWLVPWQRIISMTNDTSTSLHWPSAHAVMQHMAQVMHHAQTQASRCRALQYELDVSRQLMARALQQQQATLASASREMIEQYQHVLAYAHYLDEHIQRQRADRHLRYDFDDVCESGFNLKLMAQSLQLLHSRQSRLEIVPLAALLQQSLIALAPSLERRSMRLSSAGVDDAATAWADPVLLAQALWMVMLGTIRYAAPESTLRLRCQHEASGTHAVLALTISELAPGQLTPEERHAHLVRQLQHASAHMFAETIRLHANVQLAQWLLERSGAQIVITPISQWACDISFILPMVKK